MTPRRRAPSRVLRSAISRCRQRTALRRPRRRPASGAWRSAAPPVSRAPRSASADTRRVPGAARLSAPAAPPAVAPRAAVPRDRDSYHPRRAFAARQPPAVASRRAGARPRAGTVDRRGAGADRHPAPAVDRGRRHRPRRTAGHGAVRRRTRRRRSSARPRPLVALASGIWHENFGDAVYVYRVGVVGSVSGLAVLLAARAVARLTRPRALRAAGRRRRDRRRHAHARGHRRAPQRPPGPTLADVCIVDAISQGELRAPRRPRGGRRRRCGRGALAARPPATIDGSATPSNHASSRHVDDALLSRSRPTTRTTAAACAPRRSSALIVPLRARGRRLGSLTLITPERSGQAPRRRGPRVRTGPRRSRGARARQRRPVLRARDDRGPAHGRAVDAGRGGHRPARARAP